MSAFSTYPHSTLNPLAPVFIPSTYGQASCLRGLLSGTCRCQRPNTVHGTTPLQSFPTNPIRRPIPIVRPSPTARGALGPAINLVRAPPNRTRTTRIHPSPSLSSSNPRSSMSTGRLPLVPPSPEALGPPISLIRTVLSRNVNTHIHSPPNAFNSNSSPTSTSSSRSTPNSTWTPTLNADSASTAISIPDSALAFTPTSYSPFSNRVRPSPGLFLHSPPPCGQAFHTRYCADDPDYLEELPLPPILAEPRADVKHVWFLSFKHAEYVRSHFRFSAVAYPGKGAEWFWRGISMNTSFSMTNVITIPPSHLPISPFARYSVSDAVL